MLFADFMIRANNRTLKETPNTLNGIGVNIAPYPFLGKMVDCLMPSVFVCNSLIWRPIVSIYRFCVRCCVFANEVMQSFSASVWNSFKSCVTIALYYPCYSNLIASIAMPILVLAPEVSSKIPPPGSGQASSSITMV